VAHQRILEVIEPLLGAAGDLVLFVSDVWHRRMPTGPDDTGRFFLQVQYGRRDIAQRLRPTAQVNHLSPEAIARAGTPASARWWDCTRRASSTPEDHF